MADDLDAEWAAEGQAHLETVTGALHGTANPRDIRESELSEWLAYGRQMEALAIKVGAPAINVWLKKPGAFEMAMGRWIQESGLSPDEAAVELSRRLNAGESVPWMTSEVPIVPPYRGGI